MAELLRHRVWRPYFKLPVTGRSRPLVASQAPWSVPDLCRAYDWPSNLTGNGIIAIVELSGGWVQNDVDQYFAGLGQPSPSITDISVDGTTNNPSTATGSSEDPDIEVALDLQVAGASFYVATGRPANLRVYWTSDMAAAIRAAAIDGCDVCSISWGANEASLSPQLVNDIENAAAAAASSGMVIFASSGDNDANNGGALAVNVDVPASCPHVIGCGGTSKTTQTEVVWNNEPGSSTGNGTGGGFSTLFPTLSWQAGAPAGPGRMVPDVSAHADAEIGYDIYLGGHRQVGGTSAVPPLFAGLFAAFGKKLGFVAPVLWANQVCFSDITSGDNGSYRARIGPDPCTGLGVPIGTRLMTRLVSG